MKHFFTTLLMAFAITSIAQYKFQAEYASGGADLFAKGVVQISDGSYIQATQMQGHVMYDGVHLLATDADGVLSQDIDFDNGILNQVQAIAYNPVDSTIGVTGLTSGNQVYVTKMDESGTTAIWAFEMPGIGALTNVFSHDIFPVSDGGFIVIAAGDNGGDFSTYAIRISAAGAVTWTKRLGTAGESFSYNGSKNFYDDTYGIAGTYCNGIDCFKVVLVMNELGAIVGQKVFPEDPVNYMYNIQSMIKDPASDSIYIVGDYMDMAMPTNRATIIISCNENLTGSTQFGFDFSNQLNTTAVEMVGQNMVVIGTVQNGTNQDVFVTIRDKSMNDIYTGIIVRSQDETPLYAYSTSDNGVAISTRSFDPGAIQEKVVLNRIDALGITGCSETPQVFNNVGFTFTETTATIPNSFDANPGIFTVTLNPTVRTEVTDLINCSSPTCIMSLTSATTSFDISCFGADDGAIDLDVADAQGTPTYSWTGPAGYTNTLEDISGLAPGTYDVVVDDGSGTGCTVAGSYIINEPAVIVSAETHTNPACANDFNGSIDANVFGGVGILTYAWTGPSGFSSSSVDITGLQAGNYELVTTDGNGCTDTLNVVLVDPTSVSATVTVTDVTCNGSCDGVVYVTATGGNGVYTYDWNSTGASVLDTLSGQCATPTGSVEVVDGNGCDSDANYTIAEPSIVTASLGIVSNSTCGNSDGSATISVSGGVSSYDAIWSSGTNGLADAALAMGSYYVIGEDGNGCPADTIHFSVTDTVYGVELCIITVDTTSSHNELVWTKPSDGNIDGFNIYREAGASYIFVDFVDYDSLSYYVDSTAGVNPNVQSYRYKISVVDTCGNESEQSLFHETMHLIVTPGGGTDLNCIWDGYEGLSVTWYKIFRDSTGTGDWELVDSTGSGTFTWTDIDVPGPGADYVVQVQFPDTCSVTKALGDFNSSRSNKKGSISGGVTIIENSFVRWEAYPNPTSGMLMINGSSSKKINSIQIKSIEGRLIDVNPIQSIGSFNTNIDLSNLESGVYLISIEGVGFSSSKRIVKQ